MPDIEFVRGEIAAGPRKSPGVRPCQSCLAVVFSCHAGLDLRNDGVGGSNPSCGTSDFNKLHQCRAG
jgi:hypothetical protein